MKKMKDEKKNNLGSWALGIYCDCMPDLVEVEETLEKIRASKGQKSFLDELREASEGYLHAAKLKQYKANGLNKQAYPLVDLVRNKDKIKKEGGSGLLD